jgi:RNA polymerase sigma-70 factor (ECF subfamily)
MVISSHPGRSAPRIPAVSPDEGFEVFFRASYGRLVRALTPVAESAPAAEELVQEAMARAYDRWDRVAAMESPVGYVYATAVNLHRRHRRRALLRPLLERGVPAEPDPSDTVVARDELLAAVAKLQPGQRDALLLVAWLGLDAATAGRVLGIEPSSVRARIHRARAALQQEITR